MIIITKVDFVEIPGTVAELPISSMPPGYGYNMETLKSEIIHGRRYVNPQRGIDVVIGCTKEVQSVLGLLYDAHDGLMQRAEMAEEKLNRIQRYSFWKRLKCVFTGIKEAGE